MEASAKATFGRHRKIAPFEPGEEAALRHAARERAASLNSHVLGYGELAKREPASPIPTFRQCGGTGSTAFAPS